MLRVPLEKRQSRVHEECGTEVIPDDYEEPMHFCPKCEWLVDTEDTTLIEVK